MANELHDLIEKNRYPQGALPSAEFGDDLDEKTSSSSHPRDLNGSFLNLVLKKKLTYDTIIESVMSRPKTMTDAQQKAAAKGVAELWKGKGCEKGKCQKVWLSPFQKVHGVEPPPEYICHMPKRGRKHDTSMDDSMHDRMIKQG